jgi:hypothetical protein
MDSTEKNWATLRTINQFLKWRKQERQYLEKIKSEPANMQMMWDEGRMIDFTLLFFRIDFHYKFPDFHMKVE